MSKKELKIGHHAGISYGFDVADDGSIMLAPILITRADKLLVQKQGLHVFVQAMNDYVMKEFTRISTEETEWWKIVCEEIGISRADPWTYNAETGAIKDGRKARSKSAGRRRN